MTDAKISIHVNGQVRDLAAGSTVLALLEELGIGRKFTAVERNKSVVPKAEHATTVLEDGDRLEVVTLVGGG